MERESTSGNGIQITIRYTVGSQESTVQVDRFPFLIGRDSASIQLALPDPTVSRIHAKLTCQDGTVLLENVSATNKTAVNGKIISDPAELNSGDQAVMGSSQLFFGIEWPVESGKVSALLEESKTESMIAEQMSSGEDIVEEPEEGPAPKSTKRQVRYCRRCGQKVNGNTGSYCPNCGVRIDDSWAAPESADLLSIPASEAGVGKIMGKFICLLVGATGVFISIFWLMKSHADWAFHTTFVTGKRYSAEYFWSARGETWFTYAPQPFILLVVSIVLLIIGCCIRGNTRK